MTVPDAAAAALKRARRVAVLTGAGVSRESGISTFRGSGGHWWKRDPMKLDTAEAFRKDPRLMWEWYTDRRAGALAALPNPGHEAVARLEAAYDDVAVLTQNMDGLHQRAGSTRVLELHGNITGIRCGACGPAPSPPSPPPGGWGGLPPTCGRCGGMLMPDVVWYGEPLPAGVWEEATRAALSCDAMVVAGTSLAVSPANTLPEMAKSAGAALLEVNPEETPMSGMMDASIRDTAGAALPRLAELALSLKGAAG